MASPVIATVDGRRGTALLAGSGLFELLAAAGVRRYREPHGDGRLLIDVNELADVEAAAMAAGRGIRLQQARRRG